MEANYEGWCPVCGHRIDVGDEIVYDEDEDHWVHEDCGGDSF